MLTGPLGPLGAHGLIDEQIEEVTEALEAAPGDADLRLRRATLHRAHADYAAARSDLRAVSPDSVRYLEAQLALARLERENGRPADAATAIARHFQGGGAIIPEAWREKALIAAAIGRREEAAAAWSQYLRQATDPAATDFLAAAEAFLAQDGPAAGFRIVMEGLDRHPRAIPLHQRAAALEVRLGHESLAGKRFADLRAMYPALLPRLGFEEGRIWHATHRPDAARTAWHLALRHLHELPARKQAQPGMVRLRHDITAALSNKP